MNTLHTLTPRLIAGVGLLALLGGLGLAASHPAHSTGGPVPVAVTNAPLATKAADDPALQPVELQPAFVTVNYSTVLYTVPAGKRLVIEYVNVASNSLNDPNRYSFILIHNGVYTNFSLVPDGTPYAAASQRVTLYADAGSLVGGFFQYSGSNSVPYLYCTISGHLVDVP